MYIFDVRPGVPGYPNTISQALKAAADRLLDQESGTLRTSEETLIRVHPGIYEEQVSVTLPRVRLLGMGKGPEDTVITGSLSAREVLEDGKKRGTFRTYTCFVDASYVTLENLTVENTAGPGETAGQALALYADGDQFQAKNCRLLGHQDTLFTAPLPPKEIEPDGFLGPKQNAPRRDNTQYYENCYIEGGVDFVFGGAAALFENCIFCSNEPGFVFAPSTPEGRPYGYVCKNCRFTCAWEEGEAPGPVYLGRPWREYAKAVLLSCEIGGHIHPAGWDDWGKPLAHETALFGEYGCFGPGAGQSGRPEWCRELTEEELAFFENVKRPPR